MLKLKSGKSSGLIESLILLFFALSQPLFAESPPDLAQQGITQVTLDNGLKIIVKTDSRAPVYPT
jgi:zinc protease